jgi:uncharacterized membrane protein
VASNAKSQVQRGLFVLAILSTFPILWLIVWPMLAGEAWPRHPEHVGILYVHALGGLSMLIFGTANLYVGWTGKGMRYHKWLGYSYIVLGSIGALGGLAVSFASPHEPRSLYIGTGTLSLVWLAVAAMAWRAARNRRFQSHREWMIRSYVLTWTFVGCRWAEQAELFPWLGKEGATASVWLNWVVPLFLCELALRWNEGGRAAAHGT